MRPFSLLIKPASADCNLRCKYCFYLEKFGLYPTSKTHRMSATVLEKLISSYMKTSQPNYAFGWQGGEPTLMGLDFFKRVTELQQKYGRQGASVSNGLQSNGTLISAEMAAHFSKYNFLMGVSLDGPPEIHDYYRKTIGGTGSHAMVMKGLDTLKQHNVEFNILVLVNSQNVSRAKEIYHYYLDHGFYYLQFIPCVEFDANKNPLPFSITGRQWGEFLCELYDAWYKTDTRKVSIRFFDSMMNLLVDNIRNICHIGQNCCQYFVIEHNGDVYPCDFFVKDKLKLGNITKDSWKSLQTNPGYIDFGKQKTIWNAKCDSCKYSHYCSGDCLKHRLYGNLTDPKNISWLCEGWELFFDHSLAGFKKLADQIKIERVQEQAQQQRQHTSYTKPVTAGRNDPCPCGSGRKYKKCCGR